MVTIPTVSDIVMDKKAISVDDFILQSVEMENPYSTKNGKGVAQYTKDGKVYILETTFVDGKKQGVGNLKSAEGEQIEVLYFHDDEQCDENEYKSQASEVAFKPTDLKSIPSTMDKKKRKMRLNVAMKKSKVIPIILISLLLIAIIIGLLAYYGYSYVSTANQLSNGILSLKSCNQLRHIPSWIYSDVTAIKIGDGCCKGSSKVDSLSFSELVNCQSISVGENVLTELEILDVRGMKSLQSISIGEGSLRKLSVLSMDDDDSVDVRWQWTVHSSDDIHSIPVLVSDLRFEGERRSGIFSFISSSSSTSTAAEVLDLSPIYNLHTLSFESNSLPHLSTLQLGNLPHLQTIDISANALQNMTTLTFYSNSLNSANLIDLDLSHLTNLEEIVIGSNSLTGVQSVKATGLSNLRSFVIGEGSLMNVKE